MHTLVVWNFSKDTRLDDLKYLFGLFGALADVRFSKNKRYALVTFFDQGNAERALASPGDLRIDGCTLLAKPAKWGIM